MTTSDEVRIEIRKHNRKGRLFRAIFVVIICALTYAFYVNTKVFTDFKRTNSPSGHINCDTLRQR